jgi:hypothetical protein
MELNLIVLARSPILGRKTFLVSDRCAGFSTRLNVDVAFHLTLRSAGKSR